jgi:hypothetical protein
MAFHDMDIRRQRLAAANDLAVFLNRAAHISKVGRWPATTMIVAAIVGMLVIAMIVTVIIASIILWTALRASVLMLARAMVVIAATLIRRRRVDQRTGAEHQHA